MVMVKFRHIPQQSFIQSPHAWTNTSEKDAPWSLVQLLRFSVPSAAVNLGSTLLMQSPKQEGMLFVQIVK